MGAGRTARGRSRVTAPPSSCGRRRSPRRRAAAATSSSWTGLQRPGARRLDERVALRPDRGLAPPVTQRGGPSPQRTCRPLDGPPSSRRPTTSATRGLDGAVHGRHEDGRSSPAPHNAAPGSVPVVARRRSVLFSAVRLDRWELGNGDLWLLDVASGGARNLTPGHPGRPGQSCSQAMEALLLLQAATAPRAFGADRRRFGAHHAADGTQGVCGWDRGQPTGARWRTCTRTSRRRPTVYVRGWTRARTAAPRDDLSPGSATRSRWAPAGREVAELRRPGHRACTFRPGAGGAAPRPMIAHVACGPGCAWLNSFSVKGHCGRGSTTRSSPTCAAPNGDDVFMRGNRFDIGGGDRHDIEAGWPAMVNAGSPTPTGGHRRLVVRRRAGRLHAHEDHATRPPAWARWW
jgi:hypothetical protein